MSVPKMDPSKGSAFLLDRNRVLLSFFDPDATRAQLEMVSSMESPCGQT